MALEIPPAMEPWFRWKAGGPSMNADEWHAFWAYCDAGFTKQKARLGIDEPPDLHERRAAISDQHGFTYQRTTTETGKD